MMETVGKKTLALVLSGGGARGAYEAGILHYIRTMLPQKIRYRPFDVHCGSSVGAINTCHLAATSHDMHRQGTEVRHLWESLRSENIYRRDASALGGFLFESSKGIIRNFFKKSRKMTHFHGFLDTSPFTLGS